MLLLLRSFSQRKNGGRQHAVREQDGGIKAANPAPAREASRALLAVVGEVEGAARIQGRAHRRQIRNGNQGQSFPKTSVSMQLPASRPRRGPKGHGCGQQREDHGHAQVLGKGRGAGN